MKKMKTIPFDLAMAKEIHEGRRQGEIITRDGNAVKILWFNLKLDSGEIAFVSCKAKTPMNRIFVVDKNGFVFYDHREDSFDLLLSVPEDTPT